MEAAGKLFSTWGYDGASMDAVAAEARVTKVTVYRHFENKDALFAAALQSLFDELPTPQSVVSQEQGPLRTRLIGVADNLLRLGTGPLMMRLQRMLSLPRESASDTAEQIWERNFQPYHEAVEHLLTLEREAGAFEIVDVRVATTHLLSLIAGDPMIRLFLTGSAAQDKAAADKHVRDAVDMFLRAYGTPTIRSGAEAVR